MPCFLDPNDPKPKIDLETFNNIKREGLMSSLRSLSQKTKKKTGHKYAIKKWAS